MSPEEEQKASVEIEAVLFYKNEPVAVQELGEILERDHDEILGGLEKLKTVLEGRGVVLLNESGKVALGTAPEVSGLIEAIRKKEISGELGKAALECLTIVLYRGPIARSDIDYVRGVNSQYILRRLAMRGLVEKSIDPENARRTLYEPSLKLLSHLGITHLNDLPEYEKVKESFRQMGDLPDEDPSGSEK